MSLEIGSIVDGKVTGIAKFGAFIGLEEGKAGLVHISEISHNYVTNIAEHIAVGDLVKVKVLGESKPGKYDLSIKKATLEEKVVEVKTREVPIPTKKDLLEDKINRFLKQSEEKQTDIKKNLQFKQQGRRKKKR